jgi:hypothetical protein
LTHQTNSEAKEIQARLIAQTQASKAGIYVDTVISPSFRTAEAQIVQIPGVSGLDNNSILFEFRKDDHSRLPSNVDGCAFAAVAGFNACVLRSSDHHFGYRPSIHVWLRPGDFRNENFMILLSYIIIGHDEWQGAEINLFVAFERNGLAEEESRLSRLIEQERIPIASTRVKRIEMEPGEVFDELVSSHSKSADLVVTGLSLSKMQQDNGAFMTGFPDVQDILFVRAGELVLITDDSSSNSLPETFIGDIDHDE